MITSTSPLYFEVPEQRKYAVARFLANNAIYIFLVLTFFFTLGSAYPAMFIGYIVLAVVTALGIVFGAIAANRLRPVIKAKVADEFTKSTGITLPTDFNPLELPARTVPVTLSLVDANGQAEEWTAARNGTYFRFSPK